MSRYIKYQGKLVKFADKILKMAEWVYNEGVYYLRVIAGGGTVQNRNIVEDLYKLWEEQGRLDNIKVAILPQAGGVQRTSGIYRFFSKLFTLRTDANDVTQTTANSQPYVVNGAMVNPNGASRFMTHPTVSFGAGDAWSVSQIVNLPYSANYGTLFSHTSVLGVSKFYIDYIDKRFVFSNSAGGGFVTAPNSINRLFGKAFYLNVVADGLGGLKVYVNGVLFHTASIVTSIDLSRIGFYGLAYLNNLHTVESGALTPTQILEEYNLLRSYIPEITTTLIGTKNIATENCQIVATPMGRVITLQNTPATWATASTIYANTYAATSGTVAQKTSAALLAAAMWRSPDADLDKQSVFGKIYNDYAAALMRFDIAAYNTANPSTPWGYHVMTRAEEQALALLDADTLKSNSLWTSTNGTNETGLSLLGSGVINADGTYSDFGGKTRLITGEGYALDVNDDGTSAEIAVTTEGGILRLVKD